MQRSADLDDLDVLEVVDTDIMNQEKEEEEDGLAPPYYVPQNRSLSRLSKMDTYKVRVTVFLSLLCPENCFSLPLKPHICPFCEGGSFIIKCGGIPADDPRRRQRCK